MSEELNNKIDRRGLIGGAVRYAALSALGVWGVSGVLKHRRLLREGRCVSRGLCPECGVFDDCGLPRARAIRAKRRERDDG